jgi:photosystem II stability/assembly factor-like uncharacterized protein
MYSLVWKGDIYMQRKLVSTFTLHCLFLLFAAHSTTAAVSPNVLWKNVGRGISDTAFRIVKVNPEAPDIVYAGSGSAVYKTLNNGKTWKEIFSYRGRGGGINIFVIVASDTKMIFVGTDKGLYRSSDAGLNWKKVYTGIGKLESSVLTIAVDPSNPDIIYAGTRSGLYKTDENNSSWRKEHSLGSEARISHIAIDPVQSNIVYAATDDGIYKSIDRGNEWDRVFSANYSVRESAAELKELDNIEGEALLPENIVRKIFIDQINSNTIYAGTSEGLYISNNAGSSWLKTSEIGLTSRNIRDIYVSPDSLYVYAATDRGIFRYSSAIKSWVPLYKGLTSTNIYYLSLAPTPTDNTVSLWAATGKGLYKTESVTQETNPEHGGLEVKDIFRKFAHEPSIEDIREEAVIYAEVHPDKINKWRKAADNKAWLPDFRVSYGKGEDWQSSSYYYNYSGEKMYKDDDITKGHDDAWSVSLSWDFADLIWSGDQTSIDNRSKLMVQLRDDILNEVTRLFFERRRLQIEMINAPGKELTEKIDQELRLQELTANIDALTGSYLSKRLRQSGDMAAGL